MKIIDIIKEEISELNNRDVMYHGSDEKINHFDLEHVSDDVFRSNYGWGIYFAGTEYKAREYGNHITVVNKNNLNLLETSYVKITEEFLNDIENQLDGIKRSLSLIAYETYKYIINLLRKQVGNNFNDGRVFVLNQFKYDIDKGYSMFWKTLGFDGFNYGDYQYVMFNPDKLEIISSYHVASR
jgi:hypothetical protein